MNLSVDPRAVALYNTSPKTQLSKYAGADSNDIAGHGGKKSARKGLIGRTLRRRTRGKEQTRNNQSQSVKPKSSWQTRSLTHLVSKLREKHAGRNRSNSIYSWDDTSSSLDSVIDDASFAHSQEKDSSQAPTIMLDDDHWDAATVESDVVCEDDCETSRSECSSVMAWEPIRMERQTIVPIVDRELTRSDCSALTTFPVPSAKPLFDVVSAKKSLPKHSAKSKKISKGAPFGLQRLGMIFSNAGKKKREDLALNMVMNDTFLVYQAKARTTQIPST